MGSDVGKLARAVSRGGDDRALADNDRADRNLAALTGGLRLLERAIHEAPGVPAHLASPQPV